MIKILIGGSPCTKWSIAQSKERETTAEGIGWELFENYLFAKEKFRPDLFLYENNKSAAQPIKDQISEELDVDLMYINSSLVSAQNRQRFYGFNWTVPQPQDRRIFLQDIVDSGYVWLDKSYAYTTRCNGAIIEDTLSRHRHTMVAETFVSGSSMPCYEVKNKRVIIKGRTFEINLLDGCYTFRKLSVAEACRLQTLPDNYCRAVSDAQAYKGIGNGWTAEIIIHILNGALANIPRDEKLLVLSMYDGIGTGRYCLEKMGFTNIEYHAYEIDKYAMRVANSNYEDIIQHGDAFQLRESGWSLK